MEANTKATYSKEEDEYLNFRNMLIRGDLRILKQELIHVLYKLFIKLLRIQIGRCNSKRESNAQIKVDLARILNYKKDFLEIPSYAKEIEYLDPSIRDLPSLEVIRNDQKIGQIFSSSNLHFNIFRLFPVPLKVRIRGASHNHGYEQL